MSDAFLQTLTETPKDDDARLVYADWLEERGELLKAEFLRITVSLNTEKRSRGKRKTQRNRLQELAAQLDTDWLAVVSRLKIENCPKSRKQPWRRIPLDITFHFVCDKTWDQLQATDKQTVRHCTDCKQDVHYCDTIAEARRHATANRCIALDLGVIRRDGDISALQFMTVGMPSHETLQKELELQKPDAVSEAREKRKRELKSQTHSS